MRKDDLEILLIIVSVIVAIGGVISWWLGKFLSEKRDTVTLQIEIKYLKEDVQELKDLRGYVEELKLKVAKLESIKHGR